MIMVYLCCNARHGIRPHVIAILPPVGWDDAGGRSNLFLVSERCDVSGSVDGLTDRLALCLPADKLAMTHFTFLPLVG
jgi:hypothetical protein